MNTLLPLLGLAALVVLAAVLGLVPMILPWPQRARWLVASQAIDPITHGYAAPQFREVVITATARRDREVEVEVASPGARRGAATLVGVSMPPEDIVRLHGWCAAGLSLLMHDGPDGSVSLHGPASSVVGLVLRAAPRLRGHDEADGPARSFPERR
jgi:hypothetical protein